MSVCLSVCLSQFREENPPAETAAKMSDAEKRVMRAQSALTSGDILTAVTELDSLTGLAAKVALDWVNDAKTHLRYNLNPFLLLLHCVFCHVFSIISECVFALCLCVRSFVSVRLAIDAAGAEAAVTAATFSR